METCWTFSKHPQHSHILHTCQPSYSPERHHTLNHFEQTVHEQACHLQEFLSSTSVNHLNNSALVRTHPCWISWKSCITFSSCPSLFVSFWFHPKMFNCTLPGCLCSHLCCYPWQVLQVLKPEWFPCLLMFEIWVSFICLLQPIKLNSHVCILQIPGIKKYHKNKQSCTDLFHQHTAFTYLLEPTTTTTIPPQSHQCKGSEKNFCQV
jgi:hypothetical protein